MSYTWENALRDFQSVYSGTGKKAPICVSAFGSPEDIIVGINIIDTTSNKHKYFSLDTLVGNKILAKISDKKYEVHFEYCDSEEKFQMALACLYGIFGFEESEDELQNPDDTTPNKTFYVSELTSLLNWVKKQQIIVATS